MIAKLTDDYKKKKGYITDPCVEDPFRLAVDFASNRDSSKQWWSFSMERKEYRRIHVNPEDRPTKKWTEVYVIE